MLGRRALDERQPADVHVRVRVLLVQERGVHGGEAIEVALSHRRLAYLADAKRGQYNDPRGQHRSSRLILAAPRGYCAGVDRAVQTVERALQIHGAPVYVRKEIVHNKHVVEELSERGRDLRRGAHRGARGRGLRVLRPRRRAERARGRRRSGAWRRSTRPARSSRRSTARRCASPARATRSCSSATTATRRSKARWARRPRRSCSCRTSSDVETLEVDDPERIAYITQTTLAVDETTAILNRLRERFPKIVGPRTDDICYATTNRQAAVKQMASNCDLMLVIGSRNSSNSKRLVEVARDCGTDAHLIDNAGEVAGAVARGAPRRRHLLRRERAREPRRRAGRVLPRARRERHLRVRRRPGGRALHAPQADPRRRAAAPEGVLSTGATTAQSAPPAERSRSPGG